MPCTNHDECESRDVNAGNRQEREKALAVVRDNAEFYTRSELTELLNVVEPLIFE